jgi:radical SAM superfamily enzyme YgiQ (UPF0313 family)
MPLIPPVGLACLKAYLQENGYEVEAVDLNTDESLRLHYDDYMKVLLEGVPKDKQGNFHSIAQDVIRNHLLAHLNAKEPELYTELVKDLVYKTFYTDFNSEQIQRLSNFAEGFFSRLEQVIREIVGRVKPTVLGLSVYSGTLPASLFTGKLAKEIDPRMKIVVGGGVFADQLAIDTPNYHSFLKYSEEWLDAVIIGEGEELFLRFCDGELPAGQKVFTIADLGKGILDLQNAPLPDFSDFDCERYSNMSSYTSRSCPFQCSFCSETLQWGKYRKKSGRQIVREIRELYRQQHVQLFYMCDSLLNPVMDDVVAAMAEEEIPIYWDGCLRADRHVCDQENTLRWRRGGYYRARLGMESGSQRVLDIMGKRITVQQIKEALVSLASAGIKTSTLWLVGHPGETEEDFLLTLELIEECKDFIYDAEGTPFWYFLSQQPGSAEWNRANPHRLLYPQWAADMLMVQTWYLDTQPEREIIYQRLNRFVRHLETLGIPNPYSLKDVFRADERWQGLHKNAVPPLMEFSKKGKPLDECRAVKDLAVMAPPPEEDGDFDF